MRGRQRGTGPGDLARDLEESFELFAARAGDVAQHHEEGLVGRQQVGRSGVDGRVEAGVGAQQGIGARLAGGLGDGGVWRRHHHAFERTDTTQCLDHVAQHGE